MSRIQNVLNRADRDGVTARTRAIGDLGTPPSDAAAPPSRPETPAILGVPRPAERRPDRVVRQYRVEELSIDPLLIAALEPQSAPAEQYRIVRTRIAQAENGRPLRLLLITSPGKGDGKTITAVNLALTMGQEFQRRVLVIDADLRRPAVHRLLGIPGEPGLVDVLSGGADLDEAIVELPDCNISVLPGGMSPLHPTELLGSLAMRRVVERVRSRFDRIVLDTPPVAPLADVGVLLPLVDGALVIVRAGATPKPLIEAALADLDQRKVLGLVLNDVGVADDRYKYLEAGDELA